MRRGEAWLVGLVLSSLWASAAEAGMSVQLQSGVKLDFETSGLNDDAVVGWGTADSVCRVLADRERGVYFGYSLRAERLADSGTVRLTVGPISDQPESWQRVDWTTFCPACAVPPTPLTTQLPEYPPPTTVRAGSRFRLALLENPTTGETIFDTISVSLLDLPQGSRAGPELANVAHFAVDLQLEPDASAPGVFRARATIRAAGSGRVLARPELVITQGSKGTILYGEAGHPRMEIRLSVDPDGRTATYDATQSLAAETVQSHHVRFSLR